MPRRKTRGSAQQRQQGPVPPITSHPQLVDGSSQMASSQLTFPQQPQYGQPHTVHSYPKYSNPNERTQTWGPSGQQPPSLYGQTDYSPPTHIPTAYQPPWYGQTPYQPGQTAYSPPTHIPTAYQPPPFQPLSLEQTAYQPLSRENGQQSHHGTVMPDPLTGWPTRYEQNNGSLVELQKSGNIVSTYHINALIS